MRLIRARLLRMVDHEDLNRSLCRHEPETHVLQSIHRSLIHICITRRSTGRLGCRHEDFLHTEIEIEGPRQACLIDHWSVGTKMREIFREIRKIPTVTRENFGWLDLGIALFSGLAGWRVGGLAGSLEPEC